MADAFLADERGLVVNAALERLAGLQRPDETLAVMPEGVMVNYLSRTVNPTPFINFMPPEIVMFGEEEIVAALAGQAPDRILFIDREMSEYGYRHLWEYAPRLMEWIEKEYTLEQRVEVAGSGARRLPAALILRHRGTAFDPVSP